MEASKEQESTGLLHKILPPRLEDAGLEDCALPDESIKEAFFKAASAIKSGAASLFSDDEEDDCVQDPWPEAKGLTDEGPCVAKKSGGVVWEGGDKVVVGGSDVEEKEREKGCVDDGLKGLKIGDKKEENGGAAGGNGDEEQEEKEGERPILTEAWNHRNCMGFVWLRELLYVGLTVYHKEIEEGANNLMAGIRSKRWCFILLGAILSSFLLVASICVPAETRLKQKGSSYKTEDVEFHHVMRALNFFYQKGRVGYKHLAGMITGAAAATVYYNLKLRHPTLELPIIDYDLALLFQPMLVLGISLGVALNVIFADWTITILLIILFIVTSSKAFFKGVETWKKETKLKKEATRHLEFVEDTTEEVEDKTPPGGPISAVRAEPNQSKKEKVSIVENVYWKELGLLVAVWLIILSLQIGKNYSTTCSVKYWVLNILQIPVALGVSSYQAVSLYKGQRKIASKGEADTNWRVHQLVLYCCCGVLAGIVGGLLGLGGGFILGPLFLELGVPPQVSSATATFAMTFSASMSVIEYYLLKRFPVPYALYFAAVTTVAALVGQHVVRKLISIFGRASIIIFILSFTIFVSAISLGGVGIASMIAKIENHEYMGFENICSYEA
ncbi:hypothetical protein GH714_020856 [Hevea brasiliensis]|uniref:Sulfite exporter TauE/SafE family protein n=1 Tax=Hevea brasiliensis TaxID=3981 RepID=A0A6A6LJN2_HEVBR|nr:hypothetical protein GH714_020856 [Hevea brasiliensis]